MQLRYLQTLSSIATEQNSTIIFPLPVDLFSFCRKIQLNTMETSTNPFAFTTTTTTTSTSPDSNNTPTTGQLISTDI
jgi:hypothetical protein